jgi:alkylation response protein AidB-like acyl-CoA dehydrogenase|tara:strand:+ start:2895 stop:4067 length:1173 start_codon:yes stop_codon:yes gene_type:complete
MAQSQEHSQEHSQEQSKDFGFGEEQALLKDQARKFIEDKQPLLALRAATKGTEDPYHGGERPGSFDVAAWHEMVALGWTALAVPEAAGGLGMSLVTAVAVAEEIGRGAMPTPLTSTLQSTFVLRQASEQDAKSQQAIEWLKKIVEGSSASLAIQGASGSLEVDATDITVKNNKLNGVAYYVQDIQKVDFLVVSAKEAGHLKLFCVELNAEGVDVSYDRIVDLTRDQGRVSFSDVTATCIAESGEDVLNGALPALLTLVSADIAGGCEWLLQTTAAYAKVRTQFDRPIGFFQAVKHPIVNMMIAVDESRSLTYAAAAAYDADSDTCHRAAHFAKSNASDSAEFCANRATQLHGGIGFTWEHDVQIYHKRVMHSQQLFGDGYWQRQMAANYL